MRNIKKIFIVSIVILTVFQITGMMNYGCNTTKQKYSLIVLLEKPIENNFSDTALYLFHSNSQNPQNNFTLMDQDFSLMPDIPSPALITIDKYNNFYISNAYEKLLVLDERGNFLYKFDYPAGYYGSFSTFDEENNIYTHFRKEINNKEDTAVFKINAINKTQEQLSKNEVSLLNDKYLPPGSNEENIARKKENGINGIHYQVLPGKSKIETIFNDNEGRFISPAELIVYKLDAAFNYENTTPGDNFVYDTIDIKELAPDKVIYINSYQCDKNGNIFLSGVISYGDIERTKIQISGEEKNAVKILKLKFFIWKLQKID